MFIIFPFVAFLFGFYFVNKIRQSVTSRYLFLFRTLIFFFQYQSRTVTAFNAGIYCQHWRLLLLFQWITFLIRQNICPNEIQIELSCVNAKGRFSWFIYYVTFSPEAYRTVFVGLYAQKINWNLFIIIIWRRTFEFRVWNLFDANFYLKNMKKQSECGWNVLSVWSSNIE